MRAEPAGHSVGDDLELVALRLLTAIVADPDSAGLLDDALDLRRLLHARERHNAVDTRDDDDDGRGGELEMIIDAVSLARCALDALLKRNTDPPRPGLAPSALSISAGASIATTSATKRKAGATSPASSALGAPTRSGVRLASAPTPSPVSLLDPLAWWRDVTTRLPLGIGELDPAPTRLLLRSLLAAARADGRDAVLSHDVSREALMIQWQPFDCSIRAGDTSHAVPASHADARAAPPSSSSAPWLPVAWPLGPPPGALSPPPPPGSPPLRTSDGAAAIHTPALSAAQLRGAVAVAAFLSSGERGAAAGAAAPEAVGSFTVGAARGIEEDGDLRCKICAVAQWFSSLSALSQSESRPGCDLSDVAPGRFDWFTAVLAALVGSAGETVALIRAIAMHRPRAALYLFAWDPRTLGGLRAHLRDLERERDGARDESHEESQDDHDRDRRCRAEAPRAAASRPRVSRVTRTMTRGDGWLGEHEMPITVSAHLVEVMPQMDDG